MDWTPERISEACAMVDQGISYSTIGRHFGCSKGAVIGKVRREQIRLGLRQTVKQSDTVAKQTKTRREAIPTMAKVGTILPALPTPVKAVARLGKPCGILDVTGCKWPLEDDDRIIGGKAFCNSPKDEGCPYCAEHKAMSVADYSRELIRSTVRSALHLHKKAAA